MGDFDRESHARELALLKEKLENAELALALALAETSCLKSKHAALGHYLPFRIPFAGEGEVFSPDSVLSHCYGALLPMFSTKEATVLRLVCKELKDAVADFPWEDEKTVIKGSVAAWRACFSRARWANVSQDNLPERLTRFSSGRRIPVVDADFVHFVGLKGLNMSGCTSITDTAFKFLQGIHTLNMKFCNHSTITDETFVHLKGIHSLDFSYWSEPLEVFSNPKLSWELYIMANVV